MLVWLIQAKSNGAICVLPEVADYEVRRGLIQSGSDRGLERLDGLCNNPIFTYLPINTAAMKLAARIWADQRSRGRQTADNLRLDADAILAAQAIGFAGLRDTLTVATKNVGHFSEMNLDARPWQEIDP